MLSNYLKVTFRNLLKNRGYFVINLLGLALGITCALLIFVVIGYETSYDGHHSKAQRIYRVGAITKDREGNDNRSGDSQYPMAPAMRNDLPDLTTTLVRHDGFEVQMTLKDEGKGTEQKFLERTSGFAEPEFFDIFDVAIVQGQGKQGIKDPNTVIISESIAKKYFGNESALGKVIRRDNRTDFKVVGVMKDFPSNTNLPFEIMFSAVTLKQIENAETLEQWYGFFSQVETFTLLPENYRTAQAEAGLVNLVKKHLNAEEQSLRRYVLQPIADIHLDTETNNFAFRATAPENLWALGIVAAFLVLTACINFINLATAQAVKRSKEVGVRKVLGSSRQALIGQFLSETLVITLMAVAIAALSADLLLPAVNQLMGLHMDRSFLWNGQSALFLGLLTVAVSLLSGFYPALVLSGFKPVLAMKNSITSSHAGGLQLRRGLVVLQFAISQVLVTGTLIALQQMNYFRNSDMGFKHDAVITVGLPNNDSLRMQSLKTELQRLSEVEKVSLSFAPPASNMVWFSGFRYAERGEENFNANMKMADTDYTDLYDLQLLAGRIYNPSDTLNEIVVNEELIKQLGIKTPQEALGKSLIMGRRNREREIVGVVKNFHTYSLQQPLVGCIIGGNRSAYNIANIKLSAKNLTAALPKIEKVWTGLYPEYVYTYQFLDQSIQQFYENEEQQSNLFKTFACIAIFIGCIGLYGLVSFMATQKTKEIGVRKVLGASVGQVVMLFSKEFAKLLLLAFVLAAPVVYYVMSGWLENFAFRISLGAGVFLVSIVASALIASLTVGYKSVKAALANPVKALRSE